jgi:hypothetical protein
MAYRRPLAIVNGDIAELPYGDFIHGVNIPAKQDQLFSKSIYWWRPTNVTAGLWIGTIGAGNGSYSTATPSAAGSIYELLKRARWANVVTTTNQLLGQRNTELLWHRGANANYGGWEFYARFGFDVWTNGGRMFCGFSSTTNNVVSSGNPSVNPGTLGFCVDDTDNGAIYFMSRNAATTKMPTGFTITSLSGYECYISCDPNGSSISWYIIELNTGAYAGGSLSTNLAANTVLMSCGVLASNAALTAVGAIQIGVNSIYVQSTY